MRQTRLIAAFALPLAWLLLSGERAAAGEMPADFPAWAYPVNPPNAPRAKDDGTPKHVPGSSLTLTLLQITDRYNPPDWHPDDHPQMPPVVAQGRAPDVAACGFCHLPNGQGRPENAGLAGLPADYIKHQVADFRIGARNGSEPKRSPQNLMITIAAAVSDAEVAAAADYFAALKPKPWIKVVEADMVPKTYVTGSMLAPLEGGGTEPIGQRVIEVPQDLALTELRDSQSGFLAYAPVGSIGKGEMLAGGGAGKTIACAICHGPELRGLGTVPRIAGRSPSYLVRQLYDIQHGTRSGVGSALMRQVVARLGQDDLVALAAYLASRDP